MKYLFLITLCFPGCKNYGQCNSIPTSFDSYYQAVATVGQTQFTYVDKLPRGKSSWIIQATYHSCFGKTGYLIISTNKGNTYFHANVPAHVWSAFKNAYSSGSYYSKNIEGRYHVYLN